MSLYTKLLPDFNQLHTRWKLTIAISNHSRSL